MITKYEPIRIQGKNFDGKTDFDYWVIKLNDDSYFANSNPREEIRTTNDVEFAIQFKRKEATFEYIKLLKRYEQERKENNR